MDAISTSQLKIHCAEVVARVAKTGEPVTVTRRGRPVARIVPVEDDSPTLFGALAGHIAICGDLIEPVGEPWEAGL
ncbi:MAG: type II toxin-antitoxin system Phd/YefM family antitoxin [Deltaproteobacteria bacterium]|nr:type II toxin-antitoxin system Phd/YefM family antitoxin [Deltaproteobacteria bacterium]